MNAVRSSASARRAVARLALPLLALLVPAPARTQQETSPAANASARALSLAEAIRLAAKESETILIARAGVSRAEGQQRQARSLLRPQVSSNLTYARTLKSQFEALAGGSSPDSSTGPRPVALCTPRLPANPSAAERAAALAQAQSCAAQQGIDFTKVGFGARNQYALGLAVSQAVFSGGRIQGQGDAADAARRSAEIALVSQRAQLALDVTQAYFDAQLADRLVEIADTTLAQTNELLRQTTVSRRVGNTSEFDLLRATVTRDNQAPVVIQRRGDRDVAYLRLKQLLNVSLDDPLVLTTPLDEPDVITRVIATNASADTMALPIVPPDSSAFDRALVRESTEAVKAQEGLLRVARADRLPSLNLTSNYQRLFFPSSFLPSLTQFSENWTIGGQVGLNLFSGGRVGGQIQVAQANVDDARFRLQQARKLATLDTRVALNQLRQAEAAFAASRGTAGQARRAYGIDQIRYREGISTQTDLTQSRLLLEASVANQAQSARDLAVARARVLLIRDLPINAGALGAAAARAAPPPPPQLPPSPQPQRAQSSAASSAGAGQFGGSTP